MLLKLTRTKTIGNSVLGELIENSKKICNTLENKPYMIPELIYRVQVTRSPKFGRLLPEICQVPGRSGIRIHVGTRPEHSTGCILVPNRTIEEHITQTIHKTQKDHEEIRIEITHA